MVRQTRYRKLTEDGVFDVLYAQNLQSGEESFVERAALDCHWRRVEPSPQERDAARCLEPGDILDMRVPLPGEPVERQVRVESA